MWKQTQDWRVKEVLKFMQTSAFVHLPKPRSISKVKQETTANQRKSKKKNNNNLLDSFSSCLARYISDNWQRNVRDKARFPFTKRFRKFPKTSLGNAYRRKTCSIWHTRPIHPRLPSPSDVFPAKIQNGGTTVIVERNARLLFGRRVSR